MKKLLSLLLILALFAVPALAEQQEDPFADWNKGAPALAALISYVETVTDETSPDFIPEADRIAVFDMDGTLCAELYPTYLEYYLLERRIFCDPSYTPDEEMLAFGCMLRDHALDKSFPDGMDVLHGEHAARAYAGMTLTQFADFVTNQLVRETDGFEGMTNANTFYLPMVEVVEYLQENGFKVYVVSGSDRFICRTYIEGVLDIPYEQIIGMDVDIEATHEDGADGLKYVYTSEDNIVRTDRLLIKNLKMNKVKAIVKEIGRQPVLSFGNSSGDVSMHNYTIFNNRYKSMAFMLIADDSERDYGSAEKVAPLKEKWEQSGYVVVSMRDDFRTIYGDNVRKTGSFRWLDEFAQPVNAPVTATADEEAAFESLEFEVYGEDATVVMLHTTPDSNICIDDNGKTYRLSRAGLYTRVSDSMLFSVNQNYWDHREEDEDEPYAVGDSFRVYAENGSSVLIFLRSDDLYADASGNTYSNINGDHYYCAQTEIEYSSDPEYWANRESSAENFEFEVYGENKTVALLHGASDGTFRDEDGEIYILGEAGIYTRESDKMLFSVNADYWSDRKDSLDEPEERNGWENHDDEPDEDPAESDMDDDLI